MSQRTLAWRRAQRAKDDTRPFASTPHKAEKCWKLLYLRSEKHRRARQLGLVWPHSEWIKLMTDAQSVNVLFVCSRNQWRSPTAERIWKTTPGVSVRSAGTSAAARKRLSVADIRWADLILVMEEKHKSRIKADFRDEVRYKTLQVLDIPDDYQFNDPELIELLKQKVDPLLEAL